MGVIRAMGWDFKSLYNLLQPLVYRIFGPGGLTASVGTTTRPKTVNSVNYCASTANSQGVPVPATLAATDPLPVLPATFTALTATQSVRVRIEIDKNGVVTYKQGAVVSALGQAPIPRRSAGLATLGWIEISNVVGGFTFGTTALTVAGVTFFDGDPDLGGIEGIFPADRGLSTDIAAS